MTSSPFFRVYFSNLIFGAGILAEVSAAKSRKRHGRIYRKSKYCKQHSQKTARFSHVTISSRRQGRIKVKSSFRMVAGFASGRFFYVELLLNQLITEGQVFVLFGQAQTQPYYGLAGEISILIPNSLAKGCRKFQSRASRKPGQVC